MIVPTIFQRYSASQMWAVAAAVLFADTFVVALVLVSLSSSHQLYLDRAAITSRNTNHLVSQSITGELDRIDMALRNVQHEYSRLRTLGRINSSELTELLRLQQEMLPMAESMRVANAHGYIIYGADKQLPAGISVADRDYFTALRETPAQRLVVSQPLLGRISGRWVLVFARPLRRPDGTFDGVVYAPVAIEWFNQKFAQLEVGPRGAVVLRGDASRDFDLLARFPQAGFVGQTKVSPRFTAMIAAHPEGGTYEANAGADNIRRTFSYQAVGNYPFITLVGLSTEDTLAEWRTEATKLAVATAMFIFLTWLGGWTVLRAWNARTHAYRKVNALNEELASDIAARRNAEAEISKLNIELEHRVDERTKQLEAANKELEAFSYSVSHDLRAPLRAIDGFSNILIEDHSDKLDDEAWRLLNVVRENTRRMGQLIDDMLNFSRTGRVTLSKAEIDMEEIAREVIVELESNIKSRKPRIEIEHLPPANGDRAMMHQVFVNLISNAIKFSHTKETAIIQVGSTITPAENIYYARDNGAGFDMQFVDKLFGVFQRLHSMEEFEGTGIGLAIVKRIIDRHGGRVWAEGKVDGGATVYFALPSGDLGNA